MSENTKEFDFDFFPIGQAIKKARESKRITREQLAEIFDYSSRHIQSIENEGQYPSFQLFIQLITMFDVSVDQYIFPDKKVKISSSRRQLDALLDGFNENDLSVILAMAHKSGYNHSESSVRRRTHRRIKFSKFQNGFGYFDGA